MDWRCSCLCSGLIPSVTERSVVILKELSFPQTTPTDDAFFNRIGLERVGVIGSDQDCRWADLQAPLSLSPAEKNKKEEGSARASPVTAPMPKSVRR